MAERYFLHIDETVREPYLGVGGFICRASDVPLVEREWLGVKESMGVPPTSELKWNLPPDHSTRIAFNGTKWEAQAERAPAMVDAISRMQIVSLCDVLVDIREVDGRGPADFYRYALTWLLGRFARVLQEDAAAQGPHFVVVDEPPVVGEVRSSDPLADQPAYAWLHRRQRIAFDVYTDCYTNGFPTYPSGPPSLKSLGLYPSLLVSHADVNPLLQVADVIVGATTQCVRENLTGFTVTNAERVAPFRPLVPNIVMNPQIGDTCMPRLLTTFRGFNERKVVPYGLQLFPDRVDGWRELKEKIESWCPTVEAWW